MNVEVKGWAYGKVRDVTEQCTFTWTDKPSDRFAKLTVTNIAGTFQDGETIVGQTSGASGTIFNQYNDYFWLDTYSGDFQAGETITGQSSGATAEVVAWEGAKSYPDNITKGTFPDSLISPDLSDYLEWESSLTGAGYVMRLHINFPKEGFFVVFPIVGTGEQIDSLGQTRRLQVGLNHASVTGMTSGTQTAVVYPPGSRQYDNLMAFVISNFLFNIVHDGSGLSIVTFRFYQSGAGTFRWRIHRIKVLEIVV